MEKALLDKEPFTVLRIVPVTPARRRDGDVLMAKVDLIDPKVKLLLIDCELRRVEGSRDAYVRIQDVSALFRYFLEPGFDGEVGFEAVQRGIHLALCGHFGLMVDAGTTGGGVLSDFLTGPGWKKWIETHRTILSTKEAIVEYARSSAAVMV